MTEGEKALNREGVLGLDLTAAPNGNSPRKEVTTGGIRGPHSRESRKIFELYETLIMKEI